MRIGSSCFRPTTSTAPACPHFSFTPISRACITRSTSFMPVSRSPCSRISHKSSHRGPYFTSIVLSIFAAYVGVFWYAICLGLPRNVAVALATVGVSAPYYLTDLYGRGAWAELVAVSMVSLLLGSVMRCLDSRASGQPARSASPASQSPPLSSSAPTTSPRSSAFRSPSCSC